MSSEVRALIKAFATFLTFKFLRFLWRMNSLLLTKTWALGKVFATFFYIGMVSSTNLPMLNKARNLVKDFATTLIFIRFLSSMNYLMPIKSWTMIKVLPHSAFIRLLLIMNSLMLNKFSAMHKGFATFCTFKSSLHYQHEFSNV